MKPTLIVIGTCYSGISLTPYNQCLILQEPVSKQLYINHHKSLQTLKDVTLHQLVNEYYSVVLKPTGNEVKTHD